VPVVALVVALCGTLTCLALVAVNYRRTRKILSRIQAQSRAAEEAATAAAKQAKNDRATVEPLLTES